jgi:hypothetical protein
MCCFDAFLRSAPCSLSLGRSAGEHDYRYYLVGKDCVLGVLFHTTTHVGFEWIGEGGAPVAYDATIRYRLWSKSDVATLVRRGVYEFEHEAHLNGRHLTSVLA